MRAGHKKEDLKVGMHAFGYVAGTTQQAADEMYEGYRIAMSGSVAKDRRFPPVTRPRFNAHAGPLGAFLLGSSLDVADKIIRHSKALGGLNRVTFQMDTANMNHERLMTAIELIGNEVKPLVKENLASGC